MSVKYLKKRKLYERAKLLIKESLPLCKEFNYRFYRGCEVICGGGYEIHSQRCGDWIKIVHTQYDEETDDYIFSEQIFANFKDRKYLYEGQRHKWIEE